MEKYILNTNYILQTIGEDTILLPCGSQNEVDLTKMIVLNETSAFIIACIENTQVSLMDIQSMLEAVYQLSETDKIELKLFMKELVEKGIITKTTIEEG